jgi:hypothetical protein
LPENELPVPVQKAVGPLDVGDRVEYSLSIDGGGFWAKLGVNVRVREGETPLQTADRAEMIVDNLLQHHVKQLSSNLGGNR